MASYLTRAAIQHIRRSGTRAMGHATGGGNPAVWEKLTYFVAFPAIGLGMINAYLGHKEHEHHPRPEFVKYDYMCVRTKRFPWGDGNHSLFHNPKVNALPTGYEE